MCRDGPEIERGGHDTRPFDDEEAEFLAAMDEFRRVNRLKFPTETQRIWVLRKLGWKKG